MVSIIHASDCERWRQVLDTCGPCDVCHLPEYHSAYLTRELNSEALLWVYTDNTKVFCYPFFLSPVVLQGVAGQVETGLADISSVYGYSGPLSNSTDVSFHSDAWNAFDSWASDQGVIAEFVRFSCFVDNSGLAHPKCEISENRPIAISDFAEDSCEFLMRLPSKTRNMVRRGEKAGLSSRIETLANGLDRFRRLYERTMQRNQSTSFFEYDDRYYQYLEALPEDEVFLSSVYSENRLVSAAIALRHNEGALYHLGANDSDYMKHGAGNLCLHRMSVHLNELGVKYLTVGGGRTTDEDDPLYKFKLRNATDSTVYKIGKRVLDESAYESLIGEWKNLGNEEPDCGKLLFYR